MSQLDRIEKKLEDIERMMNDLNKKVDNMETNVIPECRKMGEHIDFIEKVYDNVKHPLGFICNRIRGISGSSDPPHRITNNSESTSTS